MKTIEQIRLDEAREQKVCWRKWGPYLSERQWGTVREDYSEGGDAWNFFTHDQARSRAYRWGEDGIAGISDDKQRLCFSVALWNGKDPILKERLFGLTNSEGNHGEDVKEYYFYLDSTPTHSYMKYLYKYPQAAFPYADEDGIAGISDDKQHLCFALALWNGKDPILKERLFGLTNSEANHGEDVKEYYFYLDSTPTHSYMKYLYKYPQAAYPYADLVETNRRRSREEMEYELLDTGVFNDDRYFDVFVEYAKAGPEDILVRITAANRGPDAAELHLLPTLWFRNDWSSWIAESNRAAEKPNLKQIKAAGGHERGRGGSSAAG